MSRGDIETLRGSIASATGQGSGAAGTASDEAEQHINSANTRLTGQRTTLNEDEETASQTSATSAASRTRAQTGNSSSRRLQDPRRNPYGQSSSFAPFHQNQAAASTFPRRDPFHGRPSAGRGDFSVRGGFGGGMRDNRAGLGSYYDGQDAYFDDQASVGSANGRQARLFSSRMLTANVAQPIGPPSGAGLYPRLDTNWASLANPAIDPRAKNLSTDDYVQIANYQDICRYSEAAADAIQDVFNGCNPDDDTSELLEQALSYLATVDKTSKNGIDDKSAKWEHGDKESQNVLAFLHRNDKSQGVRDKPGRYNPLAQDLEVYLEKKQFTAHQAALDKPNIQNARGITSGGAAKNSKKKTGPRTEPHPEGNRAARRASGASATNVPAAGSAVVRGAASAPPII